MSLVGRCLRLLGRRPRPAVDPVPTEERTPARLGRVVVHDGPDEPAPVVEAVPGPVIVLPGEAHEPREYVRVVDDTRAPRPTPPPAASPPPTATAPPVGGDRCSCGGVLVAGPRGRATCRPLGDTRSRRCHVCDLTVDVDHHDTHHPHCPRTGDCTCDFPVHPRCCPDCEAT